jgi:hypothetical protein
MHRIGFVPLRAVAVSIVIFPRMVFRLAAAMLWKGGAYCATGREDEGSVDHSEGMLDATFAEFILYHTSLPLKEPGLCW